MNAPAQLIDESTVPSVRQVLGGCLERSESADFAVARVRLAGIDLEPEEFYRLHTCRLLLGRFDADTLAEMTSGPARDHVEGLRRFLATGRLHIRAAGVGAWSPDFSIIQTTDGPRLLVGGHYFGRPEPAGGTVFTCVLSEPDAVDRARERFGQLWEAGYDVIPVIRAALENAAAPEP